MSVSYVYLSMKMKFRFHATFLLRNNVYTVDIRPHFMTYTGDTVQLAFCRRLYVMH